MLTAKYIMKCHALFSYSAHASLENINIIPYAVKTIRIDNFFLLQMCQVCTSIYLFMTPGFSKNIRCHIYAYFSKPANHHIRYQTTRKAAVSLLIAYGHFNLHQGFVWVCKR